MKKKIEVNFIVDEQSLAPTVIKMPTADAQTSEDAKGLSQHLKEQELLLRARSPNDNSGVDTIAVSSKSSLRKSVLYQVQSGTQSPYHHRAIDDGSISLKFLKSKKKDGGVKRQLGTVVIPEVTKKKRKPAKRIDLPQQ